MDDWQREQDRELWRAAQYSHIYGQKYAQNYLMWARAIPGILWTILIVVGICVAFPPVLLFGGVGLLLCGAAAAFLWIKNASQVKSQRLVQRASIERHQVAVDRLVHDLKVALVSGSDAAVGEVCKSLTREQAFQFAIPHLRVALNDIDPCQRLCAVRGLRWGKQCFVSNDQGSTTGVGDEDLPWRMLDRVIQDARETHHLRVAAAIASGNGGFTQNISVLSAGISDANADVRAACCHALGRLMVLLRENEEERRAWTETTIKQVGQNAQVQVLNALHDPHIRVRLEAAQALGEFRDPRNLRPLQELAADGTQPDTVRRAASEAVAAIKQGTSA